MAITILPPRQDPGSLFAAFSQGLGDRMARGQAEGMPPDEASRFLQTELGARAKPFVEQLTEMARQKTNESRAQQEILASQAAIQNNAVKQALDQKRLDFFEQEKALERRVAEANIAQSQASAAGSYASAASARANIAKATQELQILRENQAQNKALMDSLGLGGTPGGTTAPASSVAPTQTPATNSTGAPSPRPISAQGDMPPAVPIPTDISGGVFTRASDQVETKTPASEDATTADFVKKLEIIQQVEQGNFQVPGQPPPKSVREMVDRLTPAQKLGMAGLIRKGDIAGAMDLVQKASQPLDRGETEIAPGIFIETGKFSDNSERPMGGTQPKDKRTAVDPGLRQVALGADQWLNTNQVLKALSDADPSGAGGDVMGSAVTRRANAWLIERGLEPKGRPEFRDIREAYNTVLKHNIIGITAMLTGARQTQALRDQVQETSPKDTDTKTLRDQKIKATELTAKIFVKNEVESAVASREKVPPSLINIYRQLGLAGQNASQLRAEYLAAYKGLNYVPADPYGKRPADDAKGKIAPTKPDVEDRMTPGPKAATTNDGWSATRTK